METPRYKSGTVRRRSKYIPHWAELQPLPPESHLAPRGLPLAIPLALVGLPSPRPPLAPVDALAPRLLSTELGREVEEVGAVYFDGFFADVGLSKKEVSVVLEKG